MGRTIKGREFVEDWVIVRPGETYTECCFIDCIVQSVRGQGVAVVTHCEFHGCTFVGAWPAEFAAWGPYPAVRADEPEVVEARVDKSIRPAPRQRRSFFNWRKRG